jgi:hypothetical protein
MSYRMKITLPDPIVTQLEALADQRGEPVARVAAKMIETGIAEGERPPTRRVSPPARSLPARSEPDERPPWPPL